MRLLYRCCAGLDIHRDSVSACVRRRVRGKRGSDDRRSCIWYLHSGTGALAELAEAAQSPASGDGIDGRVLGASVEYSRGWPKGVHADAGESGDGARSARPEDGPDRRPPHCRVSAVWAVAWQLHPAPADPAVARSDTDARAHPARPQPCDQSHRSSAGNSEHQTRFGSHQYCGQEWNGDAAVARQWSARC